MVTNDYWQRQTPAKLLFPDLAWSKPENKRHAGKLLIIGGNLHGFSAPAQAFTEAQKAGIGVNRVLLPDSLQKTVGKFIPEAEYGPSTPSGSFAVKSVDTWLDLADWADGILLAGDFGRNSETAIVLEKFIANYAGPLTLTQDSIDYFTPSAKLLFDRENTVLIMSFSQLQKLATQTGFMTAFTTNMDFIHLIEALHELTAKHSVCIVTKHLDKVMVAKAGQVSSTQLTQNNDNWQISTAAHACVWELQHPNQPFEAITTSLIRPN